MKERIIKKQRTTTLAARGHHQILGCLATFSEISLASLFFRGLAWRIVTLVLLRCEPRRYHPQSKPAAHVAPCTSFNVGDEGMRCAILSRFSAVLRNLLRLSRHWHVAFVEVSGRRGLRSQS